MTALITLICLTLASAIAAGAFVYGRQIGYTQRDAESKTHELRAAVEQMEQMAQEFQQLELQYNREKQDNARGTTQGWDPSGLDARR
ncbi:hypothetical protein D3C75_340390 [compost metagenome]